MTRAVLLTGGNMGAVPQTLEKARTLIAERIGAIEQASALYRSEAWGFEAATPFVNQVLCVQTALAPEALLDAVQAVERVLGRDREAEMREKAATGQRYTSRRIDIDILFYGRLHLHTSRLQLPHPLIAEREFVLRPLAEVLGMSAEEICRKLRAEEL